MSVTTDTNTTTVDPTSLIDQASIDASNLKTSQLRQQLADAEQALPIARNAATLANAAITKAMLAGDSQAAEDAAEVAAAAAVRAERRVTAVREALGLHLSIAAPATLAAAHDRFVTEVFAKLRAVAEEHDRLEQAAAANSARATELHTLLSRASAAGHGPARTYVNIVRMVDRPPVASRTAAYELALQSEG
jgi:hypothetical protein